MKKIFNKLAVKKSVPAAREQAKHEPKTKARKPLLKKEGKNISGPGPSFGLYNLKPAAGSRRRKKLLGRGAGSGHGKTSTRGSKGQTSRAGRHFYLGFEGGQSPLIRRMPKRGFPGRSKTEYQIVNLKDINRIKESNITLSVLEEKGLIKDKDGLVKILGEGALTGPVSVQAHAFSKRAAQGIVEAGGKAEIL